MLATVYADDDIELAFFYDILKVRFREKVRFLCVNFFGQVSDKTKLQSLPDLLLVSVRCALSYRLTRDETRSISLC